MKQLKIIFFVLFFTIIFAQNVKAENIYYYNETCMDCNEIKEEMNIFCEENNIKKEILTKDIITELKKEYESKIKTPLLIYEGKLYQGKENILNFINKETNPFILLLGFIDGLNPCAISILMIFSSLLLTFNKKSKAILVGISFILGQFICNLLIGLSIIELTSFFNSINTMTNIIYVVTLLLSIYVIIVNTIDIINGLTKKTIIKNKLSNNIKFRVNEILQKGIKSNYLLIITFFVGFTIALLEFGCTGQLYLPTLIYLKDINVNFIIDLTLYNIMFSLPLIIFLILSLLFNPENISNKLSKYSYIIKIIVNIVLIILFILILKKIIY